MHTYRGIAGRWTVGFAGPDGEWRSIKVFENEAAAAALSSFLNGGELINVDRINEWSASNE
jgi:hypothetical protein